MTQTVNTRGRTLDHAAAVYDIVEPIVMLGCEDRLHRNIASRLAPLPDHRILDLGCGTGTLTAMIARYLDAGAGGEALGIDAAAAMIEAARNKRASDTCSFQVAAAEHLPFDDQTFDSVISSLFFHHVDYELKNRSLAEAFRVLKPGGRIIIADMHTPSGLFGAAISYSACWMLRQPEIRENIEGALGRLLLGGA